MSCEVKALVDRRDLRADVLVDAAVGLAGQRGANNVVNRERLIACAWLRAGRRACRSSPRLADDKKRAYRHATACCGPELRGVIHFDRHARKALDQVFGHEHACQAVPQAQNRKRSIWRSSAAVMFRPPNCAVLPVLGKTAPHRIFERERLLEISFSMKCA